MTRGRGASAERARPREGKAAGASASRRPTVRTARDARASLAAAALDARKNRGPRDADDAAGRQPAGRRTPSRSATGGVR